MSAAALNRLHMSQEITLTLDIESFRTSRATRFQPGMYCLGPIMTNYVSRHGCTVLTGTAD